MDDKKKSMFKSSSDIFNFTSEVRRLERNIGDFTRKLEQERRASILLDKEIEEMTSALNEKKTGYSTVKTNQKKVNRDHISELEEQLELVMRQLSNIRASNQKLRDKIDTLRKEKNLCSQDNKRIESEISETKIKVQEVNSDAIKFQKSLDQQNTKLLSISKSQEADNGVYSTRMSNLQSQILLDRKEGSRFLKDFTVKFAKPIADASELFQLTKNSVKNWKERCQSTILEMNKYQDFIKELNNGLQVMQKHSGKSTYQEIVDEYINSFEENIRLSNHVYELGEEIIHVNDEIVANEQQISMLNDTKETDYCNKESILKEKTKTLEELRARNIEIKSNTSEVKKNLQDLMKPLLEIQNAFKKTNLPLKLNKNKLEFEENKEPDLEVDEMKFLLKQLDEYIDQVILMKSGNWSENYLKTEGFGGKKNRYDLDFDGLVPSDEHEILTNEEMKERAKELISKYEASH
jgi:chromosome segregation ATPase